jgi:hypothetical protein
MGFDLSNRQGQSYRFNFFDWPNLLRLAEQYGWEPEGTTLDPEHLADREEDEELSPEEVAAEVAESLEKWEGGYCTNDFQVVSAEDARNLADALEKALPDIPEHDAVGHKALDLSTYSPEMREQLKALGVGRLFPVDAPISVLERFSGKRGRDYLKGFIAFCRAGEFTIT